MNLSIVFNSAVLIACVLFIGSLSGYFSERVGIANIGINGYMIFGALIFSILSNYINPLVNGQPQNSYSFLIVFLLTGMFGLVMGLLFGLGTIKLKGNHIIVGVGINLLMGGIGLFLSPNLSYISKASNLKNTYQSFGAIGNNVFFNATTAVIFAFVIVIGIISWLYMRKTKYGLRLIATGENPNAVDSQGISVYKTQWMGVLISSFMGSMAGALFMMNGQTFYFGNVQGYGFLAIAIMISGNWKIPLFAIVTAVYSIATGFVTSRSIPSLDPNLASMLPFVFTLFIIVVFSRQISPPKNLGKHFDVNKR